MPEPRINACLGCTYTRVIADEDDLGRPTPLIECRLARYIWWQPPRSEPPTFDNRCPLYLETIPSTFHSSTR